MNQKSLLRVSIRGLVRLAGYLAGLLLAVLATIVVGFAVQACLRLPDLQPWHGIALADLRADATDVPTTFAGYLALEQRLFAELQQRVLDPADAAGRGPASRYNPSSVPGQLALQAQANRSYELAPATVQGSVLLVHGLSDAPYSMRALADWYHARGFHVVSLRLPGHGTVPAGLLDVRWQDWFAAVRLAAMHARARAAGKPFHACGYSTGAALLALLAVRSTTDPALPRPDRLVFLSAAIGVSPFAALANVASSLACLPWLQKANWLDVLPEYDPFKYNSFPVNAGNQIHRLTQELQAELDRAAAAGQLAAMPPVLAFQSLVDATVTAADLVHDFLGRLPGPGHELVVFDVNRCDGWGSLVAAGPREAFARLQSATSLPFRLTLVSNAAPDTLAVAAVVREAGAVATRVEALDLAWPANVFSLGHVALSFRIDDPVYGLLPRPVERLRWPLGASVPRGEASATDLPLAAMARLRCNPFFAVIEQRLQAILDGR